MPGANAPAPCEDLHVLFTAPGRFPTPPLRSYRQTPGMRTAICSIEGIIRGADAPFAALHGFQPDELAGSPVTSVVAPHCRGELPLHILIACSRGHHVFPSIHRNRGGEEFPVRVSLRLVDGRVRYEVQDPE